MKKHFRETLPLIIAICLFIFPTCALGSTLFDVSIKHLELTKSERIIGYKLKITSGKISSLINVPIGWNVIIDNDPSWNTNLSGSIIVGAAALKAVYFRKFVQIEQFAQKDVSFDVELEVITTTDFVIEKTIKFTKKDLVLNSGK
jgi:hypothetical protein